MIDVSGMTYYREILSKDHRLDLKHRKKSVEG